MLGKGGLEFTSFVLKILEDKFSSEKMKQELEFVLDKDTEGFVLSLWKCLLYESYKLQKIIEESN